MKKMLVIVACWLAAINAEALTYNTYTDRTAWEAAVGANITENFEAETVGSFTARSFSGFSVTNTNDAEIDTAVNDGGGNANVNGSNYLYFYSNCNSTESMQISLNAAVSSLAFDWRNTDGSGDTAQMILQVDGQAFPFGPPGSGFFGIVATDGAFQNVSILDTPGDGCVLDALGLDNISWGGSAEARPVPTLSGFAVLLLIMMMLAVVSYFQMGRRRV